jgi:hypothetical protein
MADNNLLQQMLERLVNEDTAAAEELFHEYVVTASREIYQDLIESELNDEEVEEASDEDEDAVEESTHDDEEDDEDVEEGFEDIAYEADDEMGGDPTDDLEGELDAEVSDEEPKPEGEDLKDLGSIIDELQAKFDELTGDDNMDDMDDMDNMDDQEGEEMKDAFEPELETVREYVEKVPAGHGAEKKGSAESADNKKSTIDNMKNDMGGTTANILSSKEDTSTYANQGELKGSGLLKGKATEDNAGNINVPGGKAGNAFNKKEPGHGAEKKGAAESADKGAQSLFRGRR